MEFIHPHDDDFDWDFLPTHYDESVGLLHSSLPIQHQLVDGLDESTDDEDMAPIGYATHLLTNTPKKRSGTTGQADDTLFLTLCFIMISFGYMVPWTSLGSLISYYKYNYSANFYVKIYCCYYLPGLPVALLQYRLDTILDYNYGSRWTYLLRGFISYLGMIAVVVLMIWVTDRFTLIILFTLLGVCGWLCHGTASMLASMYPAYAIASLQTGFRCPEIFTVVAVAWLRLGKHPEGTALNIFFVSTAVFIFIGLIAWLHVVTNPRSLRAFEAKDTRLHNMHDSTEKKGVVASKEIGRPVIEGSTDIQPTYEQPLKRAKKLIYTMEDINMKSKVMTEVMPLCIALYFTMFCSIFQASFFAYVDSSNGWDIEQILYFVRLFSDLFGRPLTRMPRPFFLQEKKRLLRASVARLFFMMTFFVYILVPAIPR